MSSLGQADSRALRNRISADQQISPAFQNAKGKEYRLSSFMFYMSNEDQVPTSTGFAPDPSANHA